MRGRLALAAAAIALLGAGWAQGASKVDEQLPATLERIPGNTIAAYILFGVMAFLAVILIYRGVRTR